MENVNRRAALALGLTGAFIPSVALLYSASISAEAYGADEGEEVALGVRRVELGKGEAIIPRIKTGGCATSSSSRARRYRSRR